jgi:endonuclease YncB( thermonuclease family)
MQLSASLASGLGAAHAPDAPSSGVAATQGHADRVSVRAEIRTRRRYRGSRVLLALLLLLTLAASTRVHGADDATPRLPGTVVGVVDGDTVDVRLSSGMIRVRLHAIDTPERGQPYGDAAKDALSRRVFGKAVELEPYEQDRYDRLVARIWMGDLDVNAQMVKDGHAWAYRRYLDDVRYCSFEYDARQAGRGL